MLMRHPQLEREFSGKLFVQLINVTPTLYQFKLESRFSLLIHSLNYRLNSSCLFQSQNIICK
jgi:hypothetical protein